MPLIVGKPAEVPACRTLDRLFWLSLRRLFFRKENRDIKGWTMLSEGMKAPDFSLVDDSGRTWSLADFAGKTFVLYFYPRDSTPGCTIEACNFRDNFGAFREKGVEVVGVSPDTADSHAKFRRKHSLPFILLADPEKKALTAYGAYAEKTMYGRKMMGVIRSTFVIDGKGMIAKVFPKVTPVDHAHQILSIL